MHNITIEPSFNPDTLKENVEYNFDVVVVIIEEKHWTDNYIKTKTVATGYFSISGIDLTYVLMHSDLDYMEQSYAYVENYMSYIIESRFNQ